MKLINIVTEYGFDHINIIPRLDSSKITSRRTCDTSLIINEHKFDMPLMLAPMSFYDDKTIRLIKNRFLAFLPRIQAYNFAQTNENWADINIRLKHAEILYKEGYVFGVTIGVKDNFEDILALTKYTNYLLIDTANGYSETLHTYITRLSNMLFWNKKEHIKIISGNVISRQGFYSLTNNGCDIVRIGIGSGSNCTTKDTTAVSRAPLSALMEIAATNPTPGSLLIDGGIKDSRNLSLAMLFADSAMVSSVFKYTELNTHYHERSNGSKVPAYGMASEYAKTTTTDRNFIEGKLTHGEAESFEENYVKLKQGLQSAMSYLGASNLEEYRKSKYDLSYSANY